MGEAKVLNNIGLDYEMQRRPAETLEHRQQAWYVLRDAGAAIELRIAEGNSERVQARIAASR